MVMASIAVYPDMKVYVLLPSNNATGGLELLHQLVYRLRTDLNLDASLYWPHDKTLNCIAEAYAGYNNPVSYTIEDISTNILIYPEAFGCLTYAARSRHISKIMWWLSVDNFYASMLVRTRLDYAIKGLLNILCRYLHKRPVCDLPVSIQPKIPKLSKRLHHNRMVRQTKYHLYQSYYAYNFLVEAELPPEALFYLSDFLADDFLRIEPSLSRKEDIVAYNPAKGFTFTQRIIKAGTGIAFIPLANMSRDQIIDTLHSAKVYIDFGHHPGKDRFPREAAILGCCVITGNRGSAAGNLDVPIPEEYKYDEKEEVIHLIIHKIEDCLTNYQGRCKDFEHYRRMIKAEPSKFTADLKEIFVMIN
jgi:hypothetical protein